MFRERAKFCCSYFESVAENAQFYSQPRPLYREEESFKLVLRGTRNLRHGKLDRCKHFCILLQFTIQANKKNYANRCPKAVMQCKLVFPAQAGIPIHGFSLLPFLDLIFESNLCLKHFNAVRCHFLTLDRRYTSSLVDCFNGWELFLMSFFKCLYVCNKRAHTVQTAMVCVVTDVY